MDAPLQCAYVSKLFNDSIGFVKQGINPAPIHYIDRQLLDGLWKTARLEFILQLVLPFLMTNNRIIGPRVR